MRKTIYFFLIFIIACNSGTDSKKKSNYFKENDSGAEMLGSDVYTKHNFKDTKKSFNFLGESFQGRKKTVLINNIFYSASILPKEYYIKKYFKKSDSLDSYLNKMKKEEVIQFDFQYLTGTDLFKGKSASEVEALIKYLSFKVKDDFYAITLNNDTIPASGVLFERSFKLTPYKRLLLYFNFSEEQKKIKLVYQGKIFDKQLIKFGLFK